MRMPDVWSVVYTKLGGWVDVMAKVNGQKSTGKSQEAETQPRVGGWGVRIESDMEGRPASILSKYDEALPEEVGPTEGGPTVLDHQELRI